MITQLPVRQLNDALPEVPPRMKALLHDPVDLYISSLSSENSRREMRGQLRRIAKLLGRPDADSVPWENLRMPHYSHIRTLLVNYRPDPDDEHSRLAPSTINLGIAALRGVAKSVWELGYMSAEEHARVVNALKRSKGKRLPAGRAVKSGEINALMSICRTDRSPAGVRDAAIIALAYSTGMRRAELAGLDVHQYVASDPEIRVVGKGNRERALPVVGGAKAALEDWLYLRGAEPGPLFRAINKGGRVLPGGITDDAIYKLLKKRALQAGLSEKTTPHDLRRTFMTDLFASKVVPAPVIQKLAGHASMTTTAMYDRSDEAAKREAVEVLHVPYTRRYLGRSE